jgi:hypothetical protein
MPKKQLYSLRSAALLGVKRTMPAPQFGQVFGKIPLIPLPMPRNIAQNRMIVSGKWTKTETSERADRERFGC